MNPNLIEVDLSLLGIDGWEVALELKSGRGTRHVPIIAITAFALNGRRDRALEPEFIWSCDVDLNQNTVDCFDQSCLVGLKALERRRWKNHPRMRSRINEKHPWRKALDYSLPRCIRGRVIARLPASLAQVLYKALRHPSNVIEFPNRRSRMPARPRLMKIDQRSQCRTSCQRYARGDLCG